MILKGSHVYSKVVQKTEIDPEGITCGGRTFITDNRKIRQSEDCFPLWSKSPLR